MRNARAFCIKRQYTENLLSLIHCGAQNLILKETRNMFTAVTDLHRELCLDQGVPSRAGGKKETIEQTIRTLAKKMHVYNLNETEIRWDKKKPAYLNFPLRDCPVDPLWLESFSSEIDEKDFIAKVQEKHPHINKAAIQFCMDKIKQDPKSARKMIQYGIAKSLLPFNKDLGYKTIFACSGVIAAIVYFGAKRAGLNEQACLIFGMVSFLASALFTVLHEDRRVRDNRVITYFPELRNSPSDWREYQAALEIEEEPTIKEECTETTPGNAEVQQIVERKKED